MAVSQAEKAVRLRTLHGGPRILVLANAWDAGSARIVEAAGFPAVATTSAGVANCLGYADGEYAPREEVLFVVRRIAATVEVPVTADVEAGYGANSVDEVVRTVQGLLQAGAVGLNLEDAADNTGTALTDIGLQVEKIKAIRAAGDADGVPIVINARTDAFHLPHGSMEEKFNQAVERANVYRAAGADCLFVPFVTDKQIIADLVKAIDGPVNVLALPGTPPVTELERLGVRRVSLGSGPHRATLATVRRIATEVRDHGTYNAMTEQTIPYAEINQLFLSRT